MSNRLKEFRVIRKLSQQGLAVAAKVSPALMVAVERYDHRPTLCVQQRIADVLGCSPEDIWPEEPDGIGVSSSCT